MSRTAYPSDLTDEQWELLRPLVPKAPPNPGTEPYDRREIVNAILYFVRTGVQLRYLPHDRPNWHSVFAYFVRWRDDGTWDQIQQALRPRARRAFGRGTHAHLAIVDSQTAKTTESGGPRGYDGNKKMLGRKCHLIVDAAGLPIANTVAPTNVHDSKAAPDVITKAKEREPELNLVIGDKAYGGKPLQNAVSPQGVRIEVPSQETSRGAFVPVRQRWKIERSIA